MDFRSRNNLINGFNNQIKNVANVASNAATNAVNVLNSFFPEEAAAAAVPAATSAVAAAAGWNIPWGFIVLGLFLVTIIILVSVFYDQLANRISDLTGTSSKVSGPAEDAKGEEQDPLLKQKAASVVNSLIPGHKEVFHIMDNQYAYEDAEPLCKAYGAELATYDQVKDAWKKGADWCSYGWVKGQAAVYPTSEGTWNKLQQGPGDQKMACGLPGVNGGYFDNPELEFGVNCYGDKPSQSPHDASAISRGNAVPRTPAVIEYEKKVAEFRSKKGEIAVAPFNADMWSN